MFMVDVTRIEALHLIRRPMRSTCKVHRCLVLAFSLCVRLLGRGVTQDAPDPVVEQNRFPCLSPGPV